MNKIAALTITLFSLSLTGNVVAQQARNLMCSNTEEDFYIYGYQKEMPSYEFEVKRNNASLNYSNSCETEVCTIDDRPGYIDVTDNFDDRVYNVILKDKNKDNNAKFYAIPDSVVVHSPVNANKYVTFKAVYTGTDPASDSIPKSMVKKPVLLECKKELH